MQNNPEQLYQLLLPARKMAFYHFPGNGKCFIFV